MGAEWLYSTDRVKQLLVDHGWSQGNLAEEIGAKPTQACRYENGRIAYSADTLVRIAECFDCLLLNDAAPRPFRSPESGLDNRLVGLDELTDHDCELVPSFIDAHVTNVSLRAFAGAS